MPEASNCDLRLVLTSKEGCCLGFLLDPGGSKPVACSNDDASSNCCDTEEMYSSGVGSMYSGWSEASCVDIIFFFY